MVTPSPNGEQYFDEAETFIEVTKCNLTVQLFPNGMLRKTVGPASLLTLSPRSNSLDPDVATGQTDVRKDNVFCILTLSGPKLPLYQMTKF